MKLLEKILLAINIHKISQKQIDTAKNIANIFKSHIILLCVLPHDIEKASIKNVIVDFVQTNLNNLKEQFDKEGIQCSVHIEYGNVSEEVIDFSDKYNVNLIMVPPSLGWTPDTTQHEVSPIVERLIRKSTKPVLISHPNINALPGKVLCTIDFSEASERALHNAIRVCRHFKAELFVVNVMEPIKEHYSAYYDVDFEEENKYLEEENQSLFAEFLSKFNFSEINYSTTILKGEIIDQIKNFVVTKNISLLFMGATGKNFFQRVLLGSVTGLMIRTLPCSIVITKSENIINLKIDSDITMLEKYFGEAQKLSKKGFPNEAIAKLDTCLQINDLHLPTLSLISKLYSQTGNQEMAEMYSHKIDNILDKLWSKDLEKEIRKKLE